MFKDNFDIDSLRNRIPAIPAASSLVVEGGHFTLRRRILDPTPAIEGGGVFYLDAPAATAILPFETLRVPMEETPDKCWIVLTLGEGDRLELPASAADAKIRSIMPEGARYLEILDRAIDLFQALKDEVAKATFCLLIGDLELPRELRRAFGWTLSSAFRRALSRIDGSSLVLLAESTCQNRGKQVVLKPAARSCGESPYSEYLYEKFGYAVLQSEMDDNGGGYWLCADALLEPAIVGHPVIALTKYGRSKPSCAVTLAGKTVLLAATGATHHIAVYDADDDALIRQKSVEGSVVASLFAPQFPVSSVTMVREGRGSLSVDIVDPATLGKPGRLPSRAALVREVARRIQHLGFARIQSRISDVCCEIPRV